MLQHRQLYSYCNTTVALLHASAVSAKCQPSRTAHSTPCQALLQLRSATSSQHKHCSAQSFFYRKNGLDYYYIKRKFTSIPLQRSPPRKRKLQCNPSRETPLVLVVADGSAATRIPFHRRGQWRRTPRRKLEADTHADKASSFLKGNEWRNQQVATHLRR